MELVYLSVLYEQAAKEHIPLSGQFELTPVCNMKCHMCYVHKPEEDSANAGKLLPASFWIEQARQAKEAGMLVLSLTGGETLLYPELDGLMKAVSEMGFLISFNTNGTLVDQKRVEWFLKYPPTKINISLYGACNETYEALCGQKYGFDRVAGAIEALQEAGLNVYLNAVLVPENIRDLPQMHRYAASRRLVLHTTPYIFPPRDCQGDWRNIRYDGNAALPRLSAAEAAEAGCESEVCIYGSEVFKQRAANTVHYLTQMEERETWTPGFHECRAGKCSFAVNWKGEMQPCAMFPGIAVSLDKCGFLPAWEEMGRRMRAVAVPEKCLTCRKQDICPSCKAAIYQETGTHTEAPEYLCEYCDHLTELLRRKGAGNEVTIPNCGNYHYRGCTD